ncbi:MACPF domain-containing protein NSL1 [Amborella trichopoda]|uniref:MACPF domain-containing protein n=1 Tax=Amborella trichopoda TaxID=13333 RepID=U5DGD2_AMBTC|nr:MACPF domain-containing protein NSL1 [Amborella trichopoda]ERN20517.1 hypothetical protein AMTR_s00068p00188520 [Amborella trichopoda]|eukprot:XP_006859050.1 MACPF domain-containing protein NSL1 [Amborella trichopoda]
MEFQRFPMDPQIAGEKAIWAVGSGFDLTDDIWLSRCKRGPSGLRLIKIEETLVRDIDLPVGVIVSNVPKSITYGKGERTRFSSDVLSFQQMSEHFNRDLSLSGKIPSGLFNAMFGFPGCWQKDAAASQILAFDGWFITFYSVQLTKSQLTLCDHVKQQVPSSWDPAALAEFIENYGTHVVVGVKMGGKDVVSIKQQHNSSLKSTEVQKILKKLADARFSDVIPDSDKISRQKESLLGNLESHLMFSNSKNKVVSHSKKEEIVSISIRRGGIDIGQGHTQWLGTISQAPDVISMSLVPIASLLHGISGSGFLTHAVNLYLRYKPPIEELRYFLEFQVPRQWAPTFGELPLGPQCRQTGLPHLQFSFMGPKLFVNTMNVDVGKFPVTGIRLYLEGRKGNQLAIHLQHLSSLPKILQVFDEQAREPAPPKPNYFEPLKSTCFSHIYTAPVQHQGGLIDDNSAPIVTSARLEVSPKRALFLRLGFSVVGSAKIRRSEWEGTSMGPPQRSGALSSMLGLGRLGPSERVEKVELNSAVFPRAPRGPMQTSGVLKFVDVSEMVRGPESLPGYWVVSGAKLCVEGGRISMRVKYSLLTIMEGEDT